MLPILVNIAIINLNKGIFHICDVWFIQKRDQNKIKYWIRVKKLNILKYKTCHLKIFN